MPEISKQHVEKLAAIASSLKAVLDEIRGETVEVPDRVRRAVDRFVAGGVCLRCEKKKPGRYTRGLDANCYNLTIKEINRGETTEAELIRLGRLTEAQKGGRKTSIPALRELSEIASLESDADPEKTVMLDRIEKAKKARKK